MSRTLLSGADGALQAPHVDEVVFLEFDFLSGTSRACSREHSMEWNGVPWLGLGRVGMVEALAEGVELEARGIAMTLSGLTPGLLATALTPAEYKGRAVRMWCGQMEPDIIDFDFTQATMTAQVGAALATIGFTRAGATATRVNAAGLIETVAADTPRFDYDFVTHACKGLLIEDVRSNYLVWVEDFTNAAWVVGDAANPKIPNSTDIAAPDGSFTACKWVLNSTAGNRAFAQASLRTATNGQTDTFSFWVWIPSSNSAGVFSMYMYATGEVPGDAVNLNALPRNQWVLVSYTHTWGAGASGAILVNFHGNFTAPVGDMMYVWFPQLEGGAFATSRIRTTTAAVTRNADSPMISSLGSWFNASEGSVFAEVIAGTIAPSWSPTVDINDGGSGERIDFGIENVAGTAKNTYYVIDTSVIQVNALKSGNVAVPGTMTRFAAVYQANDFAISGDGLAVQTDAAGTLPTVTRIQLGTDSLGGRYLNGHFGRFTYYPKRLGNGALVALSGGSDPRAHAVSRRIATDPVGPFLFKMDQLTYQLGQTATIRLTAESRLADWQRARVRRYNNADHQGLHPGDKFFEHVEKQVEAVHLW